MANADTGGSDAGRAGQPGDTDAFLIGRLQALRTKLLDLTLRNRLVNFRNGSGAGKLLRVIDELPDVLAAKLDGGSVLILEGISEGKGRKRAEDEKLDAAVREATRSDEQYLAALERLQAGSPDGPSERELDRLAEELRKRVADELGIKLSSKPTLEELADAAGVDHRVDLPEPVLPTAEDGVQAKADASAGTAEKYRDNKVRVRAAASALETVATDLFRLARTSIEERGVNNLFLCFGFLEWYESESSDKVIQSPLLLHQVVMERQLKGAGYVFTVASTGEGLALNVTLVERLRRDFGLVLPEPLEEESPEAYFKRLGPVLRDRPNWKVRRWITLAPLAFAKIAMYRDLDPASWADPAAAIHQVPVVRLVLAGERDAGIAEEFQSEAVTSAPDLDTDAHPMADRVAIVSDADSSQLSAVLDVVAGRNLVIEGPPGTGKSQTITNIIATALAENKTVLFVAEKMAALEVVQSRLTGVGLGAFCLELHSGGKAAAIELLRKRLELRGADASLVAELDARRKQDVARLRSTVQAMHEPRGAIGLSAFELVWRLQRARDNGPGVDARVEDAPVGNATELGRVALSQLLADSAALGELINREREEFGSSPGDALGIGGNPWEGIADSELSNLAISDLVRLSGQLGAALRAVEQAAASVAEMTGWRSVTMADCSGFVRAVGTLPEVPAGVRAELFTAMADTGFAEAAQSFVTACRTRRSLAQELSGAFGGAQAMADAAAAELERLAGAVAAAGAGEINAGRAAEFAAGRAAEVTQSESHAAMLAEIARLLGLAADPRSLDADTVALVRSVAAVCRGLEERVISARLPGLVDAESQRALAAAAEQASRLEAERRELGMLLRLDGALDPEALQAAAKALQGAGLLSFLSGTYRQARSMYAGLAISSTEKVAPGEQGKRLERLAALARETRRANEDTRLKGLLGRLFEGPASDFGRAMAVWNWSESVRQAVPALHPQAAAVRRVLLEGDADVLRRLAALAGQIGESSLAVLEAGLMQLGPAATMVDLLTSRRQAATAASEVQQLVARLGLAADVLLERTIDLAEVRRRLDAAEASLRVSEPIARVLGAAFQGEQTDTAELSAAIRLRQELLAAGLSPQVTAWMLWADVSVRRRELSDRGKAIGQVLDEVSRQRDAMARSCSGGVLDERAFLGGRLDDVPLAEVAARFAGASRFADGLQRRVDLLRLMESLSEAGVGEVVRAALRYGAPTAELPAAVERVVLAGMLRKVVAGAPELRVFSGTAFAELRARFADVDRQWIAAQRTRVLQTALGRQAPAGVPGPRVGDKTELALINHEVGKTRGRISMRALLRRSARAVQALCPCFMMSPLSVAENLDPSGLRFDLLVIDEASQLRPEEALGAIARAKQVVIVGDPKQLPPTSFFEGGGGEVSEEDEESILDQAIKQITPPRRLKWHYRSRHESLIAFSNRQFYDDELVVFPSPVRDGATGLSAVKVEDAVYAAGLNQVEARRLIETAVDHARTSPGLTLGMVAMNKQQAELLADLWDQQVAADAEVAEFVARHAGTLEPVFVKNLENVQGDERDVMLVSTVYGPDASGAFFQRFGPINAAGGHRRLNVLFTRSKRRMVIFTSMDPDRIVTSENQRGPEALKGMLTYALRGQLDTNWISVGEAESPFEHAVLRRLKDRGVLVQPQVGVAGYRIDLGLIDPQRPGRFVLGVECDGATYHSAKSVRDRDRLRQEVLERLGWRIHRIWSLDWWKTPDQEFERLMRAFEQARQHAGG